MGAKRKTGKGVIPLPRAPSGRASRAKSLQQIYNEDNAEASLDKKATVLRQPHRKWFKPNREDERLGSAIGRFCARHSIRAECYHSAFEYAGIVRRWMAAKGIPLISHPEPGRGGEGPSATTVDDWRKQISLCEGHMIQAGRMPGFLAVRGAVVFEADIGDEYAEAAKLSLLALAVACGRLDKKVLEWA